MCKILGALLRMESWLYARRFFICTRKLIKKTNTNDAKRENKIKCMMNKSWWQSYDKKSLSDRNQVPLWIKGTISLWTAMEINLAMFSVYDWQSIKLLWSKWKFWDFSILRWLDLVIFWDYHPTLKLSGIPTFTLIVSLTYSIDNI